MTIEKGKVVQFHYDLFAADGKQIESSRDRDPMAYLHGYNNVIPGLEAAFEGKNAGDHFEVTLAPADAYGERLPNLQQRVSIKYFKHAGKLKPGMHVQANTDQGARMVTILKVGLKTVDVDGNHPLAGESLRFVVDVVDLRDGSDEEKEHGHAHGVGGHHH